MNWRCIFKGHAWDDWLPWWYGTPNIVRGSLEYLNDTTMVRECCACGAKQSRK